MMARSHSRLSDDYVRAGLIFCRDANIATALSSATACRLQIGDTAEFNSALHLDAFA